MNILSIHDGHNASAAIVQDGNVLSCVSEERLNRKKFYWGWPKEAIACVLQDAGITRDDIDVVTISHLDTKGYIKRRLELGNLFSWRPKIVAGNLLNIYQAWKRERDIRNMFKGAAKKPTFFFCDHHLAHAASTYYHSGFKKALVVTMDGLGDSYSHTAWVAEGDKWQRLVVGGTSESLGAFYETVTKGLGFTPNRHEGKVVGLAAYSDPHKVAKDAEGKFIEISADKMHFTRKSVADMERAVADLKEKGYTREDIAAYAQDLLERLACEHIAALIKMTGEKSVALAGGVVANVKMNQRIVERAGLEHLFVEPAMGDEGLVLGSALYYLNVIAQVPSNAPLEHVYLGTIYTNEYIEALLKEKGYAYKKETNVANLIAKLIEDRKIIGWFDGRMEFGPRALGHRTIIANPTRAAINDELNKRLNRSEFMPFAPSALWERADEIFEGVEPSRHAAEFMTITYDVKKEWRDKVGAVVHVDGTARPQLVRKEKNPAYYAVIDAYYRRTGLPLVVNTSFNMHEEPIVCSPEDALRSFDVGAVDCLIFNNTFVVMQP